MYVCGGENKKGVGGVTWVMGKKGEGKERKKKGD